MKRFQELIPVSSIPPCLGLASMALPYKEKGAYDMVIQGYGGIMSIAGNQGGQLVGEGEAPCNNYLPLLISL